MEVVPYYYKNNKSPAAFVIKNMFTKMVSESYDLYYRKTNYISEENPQPNNIELYLDNSKTYGCYCDPLSLSILESLTEEVSKIMNAKVLPSYSYTRVYSEGSKLISHRDRESCEISLTVSLYDSNKDDIKYLHIADKDESECNEEDILSIPFSVGDGLLFFGSDDTDGYYHWRDTIENEYILQTFLHYVKANGKFSHNSFEWTKK